jgi:hypothetical protein
MNKKVSVPRKVNYKGVPHQLAYVTNKEMSLMRKHGGSGEPGVGGIPTFIPDDGNRGGHSDFGGDGRDGSGAPSGPSKGEFGGGDSKDASNFSLGNYDSKAASKGKGQSQANLEAQRAAAEAAARERAKEQLKVREKKAAKKTLLDYTPVGMFSKYMGQKMRSYLGEQLDAENFVDAIFDQKGKYVGNVTKNALGMNVFTGMKVQGYTGKYAGLVAQNTPGDRDDEIETQVVKDYSGGKLDPNKNDDGVNQVLPPEPEKELKEDADLENEAKKKYGQMEQVETTPQGLLTKARTRRRSLLATGLLT